MPGMVRTEDAPQVDLAPMFVEWDHAMAVREGDVAIVKLTRGGAMSGITIRLNINQIYQALEDLRALGPQTRPKS